MVVCGVWSVSRGQDINFDQRQYHFYNAYALVHGRIDFDSSPAGAQTFLSQYYNIPFFYLALHAPPRVTGFVMGAVHGLNVWLVGVIAWTVFADFRQRSRIFAAAGATAFGVWSPAFITGLGTSLGDLAVSIPALAGVACISRKIAEVDRSARAPTRVWPMYVVGGLGIGIGAGLKWSETPFAVGVVVALVLLAVARRMPARAALFVACGSALGFVATTAWWSYQLWTRFGSPFFPYYNRIFKSPYYPDRSFFEVAGRYPLGGISGVLGLPFSTLATSRRVSPLDLRDWRFALIVVLIVIAVVTLLIRRQRPTLTTPAWFVLLTSGATYVVWALTFRIERYLAPIELLSGIILVLLLSMTIANRRVVAAAFVGVTIAVAAAVKTPDYGHIPFGPSWYAVGLPPMALTPNSMVIIASLDPVSYVIPTFPPDTRFVRVYSAAFVTPDITTAYTEAQDRMIAAHRGPFFLMARKASLAFDAHAAAYKGFALTGAPCQTIANRVDPLVLCPLKLGPAPK